MMISFKSKSPRARGEKKKERTVINEADLSQ